MKMRKYFFLITLGLITNLAYAQTNAVYSEEDKAGIKAFLMQKSINPEMYNWGVMELNEVDVKNWDTSDQWLINFSACEWSDEPVKRVEAIYFNSSDLTGTFDGTPFTELKNLQISGNGLSLNLTNNKKLEYLICHDSNITELDLTKNVNLKELGCTGNKLTTLDLTYNTQLYGAFCYSNSLIKITLPSKSKSSLQYLDITGNNFMFSTLYKYLNSALKGDYTGLTVNYVGQNIIDGGGVKYSDRINLTSEYKVDGIKTVYTWFDEATNQPVNVTDKGSGYFVAEKENAGKTLICRMTNAKYPQLTLEYRVQVRPADPAYSEDDKDGLRTFLGQESRIPGKYNWEFVGLNEDDVANWYSSESWIPKLDYCEWNDDAVKRITEIGFISSDFGGEFDASEFTELIRLSFQGGEAFTGMDLTKNKKLEYLICHDSYLTELDLTKNINLKELGCMGNQLVKLDLTYNTKLYGAFCDGNKIAKVYLPSKSKSSINYLSLSANNMTFYSLHHYLASALKGDYENLTINYSYQNTMEGGSIYYDDRINLTSEYKIDGVKTIYTWYDEATYQPVTVTDKGSGYFTAGSANVGKTLICVMTNTKYPELRLEYRVEVSGVKLRSLSSDFADNIEDANSLKSAELSLYPNPVSDILNIRTTEILTSVIIYNIAGKIVKQQDFNTEGNANSISIQDLPQGAYIVKVKTVTGEYSERIIKK